MNLYAALGGGSGDLWFEFLSHPTFWWLADLVKNHGARFRMVTQCHCDAVDDLFLGHPYIHEHQSEPWHAPTPEDAQRFSAPIDGFVPLHWVPAAFGFTPNREQPFLHLTDAEEAHLQELTGKPGPLIVAQPFAGLSDRDAFDSPAFERLVGDLVQLQPDVNVVVVGKNHERSHHYSREEILFSHPNLTNLIDQTSLRFGWHLVNRCNAFVGAHSNLIRAAWSARKRNVCVLPNPSMTDHLPKLDPKYKFGFSHAETLIATYPFSQEQNIARDFHPLDTAGIAKHLLGR